jgi:hypothetical protein
MDKLIVLISLISVIGISDDLRSSSCWGRCPLNPLKNLLLARGTSPSNKQLLKQFPTEENRFYSIDIDSDGTHDFVIESKKKWQTCFVKSDLSIKHCEKFNASLEDGFSYLYFAKVNTDPMLVLFDFSGDEDSSNFWIKTFAPKTWKIRKEKEIYPIIDSTSSTHQGLYWGYPWDITALKFAGEKTSSLQIISNSAHLTAIDWIKKPIQGVAVLFDGIPSQGEPKGTLESLRKHFKASLVSEFK